MKQIRAFLDASERSERDRRLGDALAMRMAQADEKGWKAYMRTLRRG